MSEYEQSMVRLKIKELRDTIASKELELHMLKGQLKSLQELCEHNDVEYLDTWNEVSTQWTCVDCGYYHDNSDSK